MHFSWFIKNEPKWIFAILAVYCLNYWSSLRALLIILIKLVFWVPKQLPQVIPIVFPIDLNHGTKMKKNCDYVLCFCWYSLSTWKNTIGYENLFQYNVYILSMECLPLFQCNVFFQWNNFFYSISVGYVICEVFWYIKKCLKNHWLWKSI